MPVVLLTLGLLALAISSASSAQDLGGAYRTETTRIDLALDPETGQIEARATLGFLPVSKTRDAAADRNLTLELLDPLTVISVSGTFGRVRLEALPETPDSNEADRDQKIGEDAPPPTTLYRVLFDSPQPTDEPIELDLQYSGKLRQEWQAGEQAGEIHNFQVNAHVGTEGTFLSGGAAWYPRQPLDQTLGREAWPLIDFEVTIEGVPDMLFVASGNRVGSLAPRQPGRSERWRTPFPLPTLTVAGGPHTPYSRQLGDITVYAHLSESTAQQADTVLSAMVSYLELYQPLIGSYPYREMTLVENFFSSGFAFPGFTLVASAVVQMGEGALRPGYLDHEILHNWWGNGVLGAPNEGVWSETLASYGANLMRPVLEGQHEEASAQRRSIMERLSRLTPAKNLPLDTFGLEEGASRFIGYQKGSIVLWQLAREIGQDAVWYGLRTLAATRMGQPTGWGEIESTLSRASGQDLGAFFDYWLDGSNLPDLSPSTATWSKKASGGTLQLELSGPAPLSVERFGLELGFELPDGTEKIVRKEIRIDRGATRFSLELESAPAWVELDPDFETLRRLDPELWTPTISGLAPPLPITVLRSRRESEKAAELYDVLGASIKKRFESDSSKEGENEGTPVDRAVELDARKIGKTLPDGHLLVLGQAAGSKTIVPLIAAAGLSVNPKESEFFFEGMQYKDPGHSVLGCIQRPDQPGAQLCVYWGNSEAAIEKSYLVTFYGGDSLLIFDGGRPALRRTFAPRDRLLLPRVP